MTVADSDFGMPILSPMGRRSCVRSERLSVEANRLLGSVNDQMRGVTLS
ncbi:MAG: hypothetical protein JWL74_734 [Alphaproteobacteria bacterium]|nr:hypothetical protein [Alphaproteobacteria bacterium]